MPETPSKTAARVPSSFLEYRAFYKERFFDIQNQYSQVASSVFRAYKDWNIRLENITYKQNPLNFGEISLSVAVPGDRIVLNVGLAGVSVNVSNPDWEEAERIVKAVDIGIAAVKTATGLEIGSQRAVLAMHLQAISGTLSDRVLDLVRIDANLLPGKGTRGFGVSVYKDDLTWLVDMSAFFQGALFVKMDRLFGPDVSLGDIGAQLNQDEQKLFEMLRLEVE
ncbi:MAG TPA: hypothetical protein VGR03_10340 [Candidatus Acidoferrum sp.]|nr:hypothetical protein [Candidatus Acidoferrum sp.]